MPPGRHFRRDDFVSVARAIGIDANVGNARQTRLGGLITLMLGACSAPSGSPNLGPDAAMGGSGGGGAGGAAGGPARLQAPATNFGVAAVDDTLAVAYYEPGTFTEGASDRRLLLQLFDEALAARGEALELDRQASDGQMAPPTVGTDGTTFVICWSPQGQVRCFQVRRDGASSLLFQTTGVTPTVAFRPPTWALAYGISRDRTSTTEVHVTRFAPEGTAVGDVATFPYDNYFSRPVSFVATETGFALLAGSDTVHLYRLGPDLAVVGAPLDTGLMPWSSEALAATDDEAAVAVAIPYGNVLIHVRGGDIVLRQNRTCCGKTGGSAAVAAAGTTFAVAWWSTGGALTFFDDIDHAAATAEDTLDDSPPLAIVMFRSRLLVVTVALP